MKNILAVLGFFTFLTIGEINISAAADVARAATSDTSRGKQAAANSYINSQKSNYYIYTQLDVDSACRQKIYSCLSEYCGDVTVVPGQRSGRCTYSTETELYNYALLCLQKDTSVLLPQYGVNTKNGTSGMNTAARLCPSYVQQELISYLSMANMASQLTKSHSSLCLQRRQELEAAMSCHSVAISYGNETSSMLTSQLTDYCGAGVSGGSAEMVSRFASAGNVGSNIWGWAEKIVTLDLNKKGEDWQAAVDSVLAGYTNRMNLACGDDMQVQPTTTSSGGNGQTALQSLATISVASTLKNNTGATSFPSVAVNSNIWAEVQSATDIYDYSTAKQVVQAGLTNSSITQNAYLSSAQMDTMQTAYKSGAKVFILRDSSRCYTIQVGELTSVQKSLVAQSFANCVSQ